MIYVEAYMCKYGANITDTYQEPYNVNIYTISPDSTSYCNAGSKN